jgi:hypothetical protein
MAMAGYQTVGGKKTISGKDKGLDSYKKFESVLRDTLLAMVVNGAVKKNVKRLKSASKLLQRWLRLLLKYFQIGRTRNYLQMNIL